MSDELYECLKKHKNMQVGMVQLKDFMELKKPMMLEPEHLEKALTLREEELKNYNKEKEIL